jgi:hypothetical protein
MINHVRVGDFEYVIKYDDKFIVNVKNLYSHKDEMKAYTEITLAGADMPFYSGMINFYSGRALSDLKKNMSNIQTFTTALRGKPIDMFYEEIKRYIIDLYYNDIKIVDLKDIKSTKVSYYLYPYIAVNQANVIYGFGSAGKSTLSVAICQKLLGAPIHINFLNERMDEKPFNKNILYIDYETDEIIIKSIQEGFNKKYGRKEGLFYLKAMMPLKDIQALPKVINEKNIGMVVIDSIGGAVGGSLKEEEAAMQFFSAVRKLNTTLLIITHANKSNESNANGVNMFGSAYFYNYARNIFELKRDASTTRMKHIKCNFGKIVEDRYLHLNYQDGIEVICSPFKRADESESKPVEHEDDETAEESLAKIIF